VAGDLTCLDAALTRPESSTRAAWRDRHPTRIVGGGSPDNGNSGTAGPPPRPRTASAIPGGSWRSVCGAGWALASAHPAR